MTFQLPTSLPKSNPSSMSADQFGAVLLEPRILNCKFGVRVARPRIVMILNAESVSCAVRPRLQCGCAARHLFWTAITWLTARHVTTSTALPLYRAGSVLLEAASRSAVGFWPVMPSAAISHSAEIVAVGLDPSAVGTMAPSIT